MTKGAKMATYRISAENTLVSCAMTIDANSLEEIKKRIETVLSAKLPLNFISDNQVTIIPPELLQKSVIRIEGVGE